MLLSIIIPLAADEDCWATLLNDLSQLKHQAQFILVYQHSATRDDILKFNQTAHLNLRLVSSDSGRAQAMNAGAEAAKGQWLWFIHADTRINNKAIKHLLSKLDHTSNELQLFYFWLHFSSSKIILKRLMVVNSLGLKFRSTYLLSPFGDQAFCISQKAFLKVGQYPLNVPYGEDHCLIWACHLQKVAVTPIAANISTSARKYQKGGWLNITALHSRLWFKQWLPLYCRYLRLKLQQFIHYA